MMGKEAQNRQTSDITTHNKNHPSFKWGRMFHLLDYHHWYYVKKVLANKKPHSKEVHNHSTSDPVHYGRMSSVQIREPIDKPQLQEHGIHPCISTESSSLPSSPTTKNGHVLTSSPSTKGSRATRIKRMIAREVSKRTGRHRRSSTCPVNSELGDNHNHNHSHNHSHIEDGQNDDLHHGENTCGLCSKMKIDCPLGDENQVDMQGELSLNHMNRILQENLDGSQSRNNQHLRRTVSLQQSIEFLDVRELMSKNKSFFLRIVDDQEKNISDEEGHVLKSTRNKNPLKRFGTFPINHLSSKRDDSSDVRKVNGQKSSHKYTARLEKSSTLNNDRSHAPRIRFKDLRHKIKHVIKESKIDRHIIAMDAVLHKLPYGQKMPEETPSPRVSTSCETDSMISPLPDSTKQTKTYKRRSPSLDESLNKYCHLFETTGCCKDVNKINTHKNKSRLRVMDDYLDNRERKKLGRMFSFPDLQYFLNNQCENYSGELSSKTPNKRIMSFNERKVMNDVLIVDFDYRHRFNSNNNNNNNNNDGFESWSKEEDDGVDQKMSSRSSIEVLSCDDKDSESVTTSIAEDDLHKLSETPLGDAESKLQEAIKQSEDQSYSESPTFSFTNIGEDEVKHSVEHISPTLKHVEVDNNDIEEFNYVKEILQLSGYLGTELLGTWYSSDQPVDPSIFIEFQSCSIDESNHNTWLKEISYNKHLLLFDVINETLLAIYERSVSYWCAPLSTCSRAHPMPKGYRILDEVWTYIKWYMNCSKPELDPTLDCITTRDLAKDDRWMNLQFDAECVGLEVEELIFEDLLDELTY